MRYAIVLFLIFSAFCIVLAQTPDQVPNLKQPRYQIFTSGQPTEEGFHVLASKGIRTVINVLPEKECVANEEAMVTSAHMTYRKVPFSTSDFKMETIQQFADTLKDAEKPVLIHCSTGNHVGGLWFAYRTLVEKSPLPQALIEARQIGMKPALEDAIFIWVTSSHQEAQR